MSTTNASTVAELAEWLTLHDEQIVGIALEFQLQGDGQLLTRLRLGGQVDADELEIELNEDATIVLRHAFERHGGVQFVPYSIPDATWGLANITGLTREEILAHMPGDVQAVEQTIVPTEVTNYTPQDYLRRWRAARQMVMPAYYNAIAVPLQRLQATDPEAPTTWRVTYTDLLLRVIAKVSGEPQLTRAFLAEEYPAQAYLTNQLQDIYDGVDHEFAFACLVWAALGGDYPYMQLGYPELAARLEGLDFGALAHNMDRMVPALRLWAATAYQDGVGRTYETLYGRRLAWVGVDPEPGVYLDFLLAGTVEDLLSVLAVSMTRLGARPRWKPVAPAAPRHSLRGDYDARDPYEFLAELRQVAVLGSPLSPVPLGPVVALEDE